MGLGLGLGLTLLEHSQGLVLTENDGRIFAILR